MAFLFRRTGIALVSSLLIFYSSCEKHHLGELPEVQKEHIDLAAKPNEAPERSTSPSENEKVPTPAEFFTPTKSP